MHVEMRSKKGRHWKPIALPQDPAVYAAQNVLHLTLLTTENRLLAITLNANELAVLLASSAKLNELEASHEKV